MEEINKAQQRNLSDKQLDVLKLLFRFRFGTTDLISEAQGSISRNSAHVRLTWLLERGFIKKKLDGRSRLQNKPAIYSLAAKGRKVLSEDPSKYSPKVLNSIRANRDPSDDFIDHCLSLFSLSNNLQKSHGESFVMLTKSNIEIDKFDYLPEVRPDAFLYLPDNKRYYFLYLFDGDKPDYAFVRRIMPIFEYEKSGKWEASTGEELPHILIACEKNRVETVIRKRLSKLTSSSESELLFATTTLDKVLSTEATTPWRALSNDDKVSLSDFK